MKRTPYPAAGQGAAGAHCANLITRWPDIPAYKHASALRFSLTVLGICYKQLIARKTFASRLSMVHSPPKVTTQAVT